MEHTDPGKIHISDFSELQELTTDKFHTSLVLFLSRYLLPVCHVQKVGTETTGKMDKEL